MHRVVGICEQGLIFVKGGQINRQFSVGDLFRLLYVIHSHKQPWFLYCSLTARYVNITQIATQLLLVFT